jgi:ribonuclease VapC
VILLDASALIALLNDEPGADVVAAALTADVGALSVVNLAEVFEVGVRTGAGDARQQLQYLRQRITTVPVTEEDAVVAAELYAVTRRPPLSLADRIAVATARRLGVEVLTAEPPRVWADVPAVNVRLIR